MRRGPEDDIREHGRTNSLSRHRIIVQNPSDLIDKRNQDSEIENLTASTYDGTKAGG